jgi:hypothetical protein
MSKALLISILVLACSVHSFGVGPDQPTNQQSSTASPKRVVPKVTHPAVMVVSMKYPGADAKTVEREVGKVVEDAVNGIKGVKALTATCAAGAYRLEVTFEAGTEIAMAKVLMQNRMMQITAKLPKAATQSGIRVNVLSTATFSTAVGRRYIASNEAKRLSNSLPKGIAVMQHRYSSTPLFGDPVQSELLYLVPSGRADVGFGDESKRAQVYLLPRDLVGIIRSDGPAPWTVYTTPTHLLLVFSSFDQWKRKEIKQWIVDAGYKPITGRSKVKGIGMTPAAQAASQRITTLSPAQTKLHPPQVHPMNLAAASSFVPVGFVARAIDDPLVIPLSDKKTAMVVQRFQETGIQRWGTTGYNFKDTPSQLFVYYTVHLKTQRPVMKGETYLIVAGKGPPARLQVTSILPDTPENRTSVEAAMKEYKVFLALSPVDMVKRILAEPMDGREKEMAVWMKTVGGTYRSDREYAAELLSERIRKIQDDPNQSLAKSPWWIDYLAETRVVGPLLDVLQRGGAIRSPDVARRYLSGLMSNSELRHAWRIVELSDNFTSQGAVSTKDVHAALCWITHLNISLPAGASLKKTWASALNQAGVDPAHRFVKIGPWSRPVDGLQGRLVVYRRLNRTRLYQYTGRLDLLLEVRNVSSKPLGIDFYYTGGDSKALQCRVAGPKGKPVARTTGFKRRRPATTSCVMVLQPGRRQGIMVPGWNGVLAGSLPPFSLDLGGDKVWTFSPQDGPFTIRGTLTIDRSTQCDHSPNGCWRGTLQLPPVQVPLANRNKVKLPTAVTQSGTTSESKTLPLRPEGK